MALGRPSCLCAPALSPRCLPLTGTSELLLPDSLASTGVAGSSLATASAVVAWPGNGEPTKKVDSRMSAAPTRSRLMMFRTVWITPAMVPSKRGLALPADLRLDRNPLYLKSQRLLGLADRSPRAFSSPTPREPPPPHREPRRLPGSRWAHGWLASPASFLECFQSRRVTALCTQWARIGARSPPVTS